MWLATRVSRGFHRDGATGATGFTLACLDRAGIVTVAPALAGAERFGAICRSSVPSLLVASGLLARQHPLHRRIGSCHAETGRWGTLSVC